MANEMLEHPNLQLLSTNIEKKMRADGFDFYRNMTISGVTSYETLLFSCSTLQQVPYNWEYRIYGSTGEGLVYPLNIACEKDIDCVCIHGTIIAVESVHEAIQYYTGNQVFLIENDHLLPGYSYLRAISQGSVSAFLSVLFPGTVEISGLHYLSGSVVKDTVQNSLSTRGALSDWQASICNFYANIHAGPLDQQGPATHFHFKTDPAYLQGAMKFSKIDIVPVLRCPKWPSSASEWVTRRRTYSWPSEKLITEIVAQGIYLAPVGCKQHPLEGMQWRYSFNEAERRLARSFNPTQAKCYVLLKRVISENVTELFGDDVISSYHLKTLMFRTIEETDPQVWLPANLIQCVFLVLDRLAKCTEEGHCPGYFIPDENLFLCKITQKNKRDVLACIKGIIAEGWPVLTRLSCFDDEFIQNIHREYNIDVELELPDTVCDRVFSLVNVLVDEGIALQLCVDVTDVCKIHEADRICSNFNRTINHLIRETNACDYTRRKESMKNVISYVCSSYGTHCLSLSRRPAVGSLERGELENLGDIYIELSSLRKQVECLTKHANYAYMRGNLQSTLSTANSMIQKYFLNQGYDISRYVPFDEQQQCMLNSLVNRIERIDWRREVIFTKNEIYAVPGNAKVEIFMVGHVSDTLKPLSRFRQSMVVDPYFYVTYLAFLTYCDIKLQDKADEAIRTMEILASMPPNSYLPSSINLLGDCYLKRGNVDKAMEKFAFSMQRNSARNTAPWHVARLVWRKLFDRWLQTRDGSD